MLKTTSEVMDILGGNQAVADITKRNYGTAAAWRPRANFPARTYLVLRKALKQIGETAPDSLWGMTE